MYSKKVQLFMKFISCCKFRLEAIENSPSLLNKESKGHNKKFNEASE